MHSNWWTCGHAAMQCFNFEPFGNAVVVWLCKTNKLDVTNSLCIDALVEAYNCFGLSNDFAETSNCFILLPNSPKIRQKLCLDISLLYAKNTFSWRYTGQF